MTRRFCDKCGREEETQRVVKTPVGFRDHVPRFLDLCDDCRKALQRLIDEWLVDELLSQRESEAA